jgi:hypothetical protein
MSFDEGRMEVDQLQPGQLVRARVDIRATNTDLKFAYLWGAPQDIPKGTVFKVGGVHQLEEWVDLYAEQYVGLNRRFTFVEMARLFVFVDGPIS